MSFSDNHFDEMERIGQISLFEILDKPLYGNGSTVRITNLNNLPVEDQEHFREYRKHIINVRGVVLKSKVLKDGKTIVYNVDFNGHAEQCYQHELEEL